MLHPGRTFLRLRAILDNDDPIVANAVLHVGEIGEVFVQTGELHARYSVSFPDVKERLCKTAEDASASAGRHEKWLPRLRQSSARGAVMIPTSFRRPRGHARDLGLMRPSLGSG